MSSCSLTYIVDELVVCDDENNNFEMMMMIHPESVDARIEKR
jgi:hypothetical protein